MCVSPTTIPYGSVGSMNDSSTPVPLRLARPITLNWDQ
jgi:hypothetical protein